MGNTASVAVSVGVPLVLGQVMGLISAPDVLKWYPGLKKVRRRAGQGARSSGI
jgi:hypothetical protein